MDLILWRHADAGDPLDDIALDLQRKLTAKGEKQAARMADWLNRFLPESTRVLVSPALRCQQTAQALGRKFQTREALGPGGTVGHLLTLARWPDRRANSPPASANASASHRSPCWSAFPPTPNTTSSTVDSP